MCGRFSIAGFEGFKERFQLKIEFLDLKPNYNVAPSQDIPVILNRGQTSVLYLSGDSYHFGRKILRWVIS